MSLFHFHKWTIASCDQVTATIHGYFIGAMFMPFPEAISQPKTQVLYRCKCGKVKSESINGHWEIEVLRGGSGSE